MLQYHLLQISNQILSLVYEDYYQDAMLMNQEATTRESYQLAPQFPSLLLLFLLEHFSLPSTLPLVSINIVPVLIVKMQLHKYQKLYTQSQDVHNYHLMIFEIWHSDPHKARQQTPTVNYQRFQMLLPPQRDFCIQGVHQVPMQEYARQLNLYHSKQSYSRAKAIGN